MGGWWGRPGMLNALQGAGKRRDAGRMRRMMRMPLCSSGRFTSGARARAGQQGTRQGAQRRLAAGGSSCPCRPVCPAEGPLLPPSLGSGPPPARNKAPPRSSRVGTGWWLAGHRLRWTRRRRRLSPGCNFGWGRPAGRQAAPCGFPPSLLLHKRRAAEGSGGGESASMHCLLLLLLLLPAVFDLHLGGPRRRRSSPCALFFAARLLRDCEWSNKAARGRLRLFVWSRDKRVTLLLLPRVCGRPMEPPRLGLKKPSNRSEEGTCSNEPEP